MTYAIINGTLCDGADATVSIDDRGFLYGDSVFTTLLLRRGKAFRLARHIERLNASLADPLIDISCRVEKDRLENDLQRLTDAAGSDDGIARIRVTRGNAPGAVPPTDLAPTVVVTFNPAPSSASAPGPFALMRSSIRRDPSGVLGRHKLGSYAPSLMARREALLAGFNEAIITDTDGLLLECTSANLFLVRGGVLVTPSADQNLLPGITREAVLDCARDLGLPIEETRVPAEMADKADELCITNAGLGIVAVCRYESRSLDNVPGPVTQALQEAYRQRVFEECTSPE